MLEKKTNVNKKTNLRAALKLAELGYYVFLIHHVFPDGRCSCGDDDCKNVGKHPRTLHGFKDATNDPGLIKEWWGQHPRANIGIGCEASGICVLDVDNKHGECGSEVISRFLENEGVSAPEMTARTPNNGFHLYARDPKKIFGSYKGKDKLSGLDTRGIGGYIIAPPSAGANGNCYEWLNGLSPVSELPLVPEWMAKLHRAIKKSKEGKATKTKASGDSANWNVILEGRRDVSLASIAGTVWHYTGDPEKVRAHLVRANLRCVPPLGDSDIDKVTRSITTNYERVQRDFELSDEGNAQRFVAYHGDRIRYVGARKRWFFWDGEIWREDAIDDVMWLAQTMIDALSEEANNSDDPDTLKELKKHWRNTNNGRRLQDLLTRAQKNPAIRAQPNDFDNKPMLINFLNGTYEIDAGNWEGCFREFRREDMLTKQIPVSYDEEAECRLWKQSLLVPHNGDEEQVREFQKFVGSCLIGANRDKKFVILKGETDGGKSCSTDFLRLEIFGPYGGLLSKDAFVTRKFIASHQEELTNLMGKRFVTVSEPEDVKRFNTTLVKSVTGDREIRVSGKGLREIDFPIQCKIFMMMNDLPNVQVSDNAFWNRPVIFPISTIPMEQQDPDIFDKWSVEKEGILQWCLEGLRLYWREGFTPTARMQRELETWQGLEDPLRGFLCECSRLEYGKHNEDSKNPNDWYAVSVSKLHGAYVDFMVPRSEDPKNLPAFAKHLRHNKLGIEIEAVGHDKQAFAFGVRLNGTNRERVRRKNAGGKPQFAGGKIKDTPRIVKP